METFGFLWQLLESHGVVPSRKQECAQLWATFTLEQQRHIYRSIRDKIRAGKFVHYNPVLAVRENAPKAPRIQVISADEYYRRYGTQTNQDGWVRTFLPEQQKTIYVKNN